MSKLHQEEFLKESAKFVPLYQGFKPKLGGSSEQRKRKKMWTNKSEGEREK